MIYNDIKRNILKTCLIGFATVTIIASGEPTLNNTSTDTTDINNPSQNPVDLLGLGILPDDTISKNKIVLTVSTNGQVATFELDVKAENKARANSRYYDKASNTWVRIAAHTLILNSGIKTGVTVDSGNKSITINSLDLGNGADNKIAIILKSGTEYAQIEIAGKVLNQSELAGLSNALQNIIDNLSSNSFNQDDLFTAIKPILSDFGIVLPDDFKETIQAAVSSVQNGSIKIGGMLLPLSYKGITLGQLGGVIQNGGSAETGGLYGGFILANGDNKQYTSFYAKEEGSTHIGASEGTSGSHNVLFAGASDINGKVDTLIGKGMLDVDFSAGTLKTNGDGIEVTSIFNGNFANPDKLAFNLSYDAADKIFKSDQATYKRGGDTVTGNAEAAVFKKDNKQSILGSVDLRTGNNVVVGGFGSVPTLKDLNGNDIPFDPFASAPAAAQ